MKIHFKYIGHILAFVIFCWTNNTHSQNTNTNSLSLTITQTAINGSDYIECVYSLKNGRLSVSGTKEYYTDTSYYKKTEMLISKKLSTKKIDSLCVIIWGINSIKLDSVYNTKYFILPGVAWNFEIKYKNKIIKTYLNSHYMPSFDKLILFLNNELPIDKRVISFDILDVKKTYLKKMK